MQTVVIDRVTIVKPEIAAVVRDKLEVIPAALEDSRTASPTYSEVIVPGKSRPSAAGVPVVNIMLPSSHVRPASVQIRATTTLSKIEGILPEETMPINNSMRLPSARTNRQPFVSSVVAMVPEEHASMTTMFKHFESHHAPSTKVLPCHTATPPVTAIIVDRVPIINKQIAAVVRDKLEVIPAASEDSHASSPTHSEVVTSLKTRPSASSVPVVYFMSPTSHVRPASVEILATTTLTEVERIFHEKTMAICDTITAMPPSAGADNHPAVSCIMTTVPEKHASMTTMFKHFESDHAPSSQMSPCLTITPPVTAIIVDRVPIINKQIAAVVRDNAVMIPAASEDSHASCPTHSKVIVPGEARPSATCVPVVYHLTPSLHVRPATV
jgi:hypothetical protein